MEDVPKTLTQREESRQRIADYEQLLKQQDGAFIGDNELTPSFHHFSDGVYTRELHVPAGCEIVGKIHNKSHINILVKGIMDVATEAGAKRLEAPCIFVAPPGIQKVGRAITDVVWVNCHPNPSNSQDLEVLEKEFVSDTFEEYENKLLEFETKKLA